ncbi:dipeptidase [Cupriavidus sp. amp6]|uniref:dipeptidase n=1 Tax=Cupriavidus sp. amp6 TaxID=388051 RepID=UPI00048F26F0|nr:dipeptidase [Cupriavidus sp. amp6]
MSQETLHSRSIIIDGTCPLLYDLEYTGNCVAGGLTAVVPTVQNAGGVVGSLNNIGAWHNKIRNDDKLLLVRSAADILKAKETGKMGIILHFQGADPLEDKIDLVDAYKAAGIGMIQLTYNVKNRLGDGCEERTDAGLSKFGVAVIKRMNEARIVVDVSHTGYRTTMETFEVSERPVVFSHACARAVYGSQRNILDDQIKAVAATGGLVGVAAVPFFVSDSKRPTMDDFVRHIDHMVSLVGPDHVALGLDYYTGQHPYSSDEAAMALYKGHLKQGRWGASYPPPPYYYPEGMETPDRLGNLTEGLRARGYSEDDTQKIMGLNWFRVFKEVWGG